MQSAKVEQSEKENKLVETKSIICHRTLKERAEAYDGELHLSEEYDWGEPVGDEVW
ncbi:MAG: streptomycin biosynthesis protein StrG [Clostridia bacterium]|nr:streptomycin biosynthesis protein StrG [Clostridia bacterium]MBR0406435.1 streptomycin biosynthesis protein StrG [Clostridia bacterium]